MEVLFDKIPAFERDDVVYFFLVLVPILTACAVSIIWVTLRALAPLISAAVEPIANAIGTIVASIVEAASSTIQTIAQGLADLLKSVFSMGREVASAVKSRASAPKVKFDDPPPKPPNA